MINVNENEAENEKQRYDINRPTPRHGHKYTKYKLCLSICRTLATFEAQFMEKLSNIEVELKKSVAYKKACSYNRNGNTTI